MNKTDKPPDGPYFLVEMIQEINKHTYKKIITICDNSYKGNKQGKKKVTFSEYLLPARHYTNLPLH